MSDANPELETQRRKRMWTTVGGSVAFAAIGLALLPLLLKHEVVPVEGSSRTPTSLGRASENPLRPWRLERPPETAASIPETEAGRVFDCMIGPSEVVDIGSPITGRIERIPVERSDYVEGGEIVAQLDASVEDDPAWAGVRARGSELRAQLAQRLCLIPRSGPTGPDLSARRSA